MGGENSRDNSATDYVRSQEESKTVAVTGESIKQQQQEAFAEARDSWSQKVNDIEESLKNDTSVPNLIHHLSALIELKGTDKMECVNRIVESMGSEWRNLMSDEKKMTKVVGAPAMAKLKNTRLRYFSLLLRTKRVIVELLEESEMRKENVADALRVVTTAKDDPEGDGKLKDKERFLFDESIRLLSGWIDHSELVKVTQEWNALSLELEEQKSMFTKMFEKYKKKSFWMKVAIGFGAVIALAAVIGLIIATSGAGALVAGAIGTTTVSAKGIGITFITKHLVCAGIGLTASAFIVGGGIAYGYHVKPAEMARKIEKITTMLNDYIQNCLKIQKEVSKMEESSKQIRKRIVFNTESCEIIYRSLTKIDKYLADYIQQGNEVVDAIEKACEEFVK